ncbi:40S ribosomal protein S3a [Tupaia chinensis]|uniref:40S ribosomal protein S3a n=1 Tax=Tupaia chinensis TaxID=246437 RepID=L9JAB2_TUPCH|nr:40S ribosomal protein S3a [Tupaia chinensis]
MTCEVQTNGLKDLVNKLTPDGIGKDTEKACQSIYPLHDVFISTVKMLQKPKFELGKLMELHGEEMASACLDTAVPSAQPEAEEEDCVCARTWTAQHPESRETGLPTAACAGRSEESGVLQPPYSP